jgi:hypothetical protein
MWTVSKQNQKLWLCSDSAIAYTGPQLGLRYWLSLFESGQSREISIFVEHNNWGMECKKQKFVCSVVKKKIYVQHTKFCFC